MQNKPHVIILGHSFVRRMKEFLESVNNKLTSIDFNLKDVARISIHGIGGGTVRKLRLLDLNNVVAKRPDFVLFEIGTNDLTTMSPEIVAQEINTICDDLHAEFNVHKIVVSQIIYRKNNPQFNKLVDTCNNLVSALIRDKSHAHFWIHKGLKNPSLDILRRDGVHLNERGNYALYRNYRGAILHMQK